MAIQAYVFVYVQPKKSKAVLQAIAKVPGVKAAHVCWGRPDIIAFVEADDPKALAGLVLNKIQAIAGVETTDTRIVAEV